jgi:hypothetical protein
MLRGGQASQLIHAVLGELLPLIPDGWTITVGQGRGASVSARYLWSKESGLPLNLAMLGQLGSSCQFGLGPPLHRFWPTRFVAKASTQEALELIQAAVQSPDHPWPAPNMAPRTKIYEDTVLLWFEDPQGHRIDAGQISAQLTS